MSAMDDLISKVVNAPTDTYSSFVKLAESAQAELLELRQQVEGLRVELESRNRETINLNKDRDKAQAEADRLKRIGGEMAELLSDILYKDATGFGIGTLSPLGKRITAALAAWEGEKIDPGTGQQIKP